MEQYLAESNISPEMLCQNFENLLNSSNEALYDLNDAMELPEIIEKVLEGYKEYCQDTINGKHGKTAQFYLQYYEFINLFLRFLRSIQSNNFQLQFMICLICSSALINPITLDGLLSI